MQRTKLSIEIPIFVWIRYECGAKETSYENVSCNDFRHGRTWCGHHSDRFSHHDSHWRHSFTIWQNGTSVGGYEQQHKTGKLIQIDELDRSQMDQIEFLVFLSSQCRKVSTMELIMTIILDTWIETMNHMMFIPVTNILVFAQNAPQFILTQYSGNHTVVVHRSEQIRVDSKIPNDQSEQGNIRQ